MCLVLSPHSSSALIAATLRFRWLVPSLPLAADRVVVPHLFTRFFGIGKFYDYFYTMARAGFDTDEFRATNGDDRETLGTLWYHDHLGL